MKTLPIVLLFLLFSLQNLFAQTIDEILEEHFNVIGQEKLLQINTFTTKGKIIQGQYEIPFISYHKRPMFFRSEASFQGMEIVSVFDGENGWSLNPFTGATEPQPMTEEQLDRMTIQADFDGMLYNYKEKGYEVEFTGTEDVDDIETYVLKLTRPNGDVITNYIDTENYILLKAKSQMKIQGVDMETETFYSNYKQENEMLVPFEIETKRDGQTLMQMVFDEFNYDVEIADSLFAMQEVTAVEDEVLLPDTTTSKENQEK